MKPNSLSLHTPSTPGVGSKGQISFSFLKMVMLHIKLKVEDVQSNMQA